MRYKLIKILLVLIMLPLNAFSYIAKPTSLTPTIKWEITDDGVLRIYGTGEIPGEEYSDKPTHWRKPKYYPDKIKRIEIGEGITTIGHDVFYNTNGVHNAWSNTKLSVRLPSTLKAIAPRGLAGVSITESALPDGIVDLGEFAFNKSLFPDGKVIIPASVKRIGEKCFSFSNVKEIIIRGCPIIETGAFNNMIEEVTVKFENSDIDLSRITEIKQHNDYRANTNHITFLLEKNTTIPKEFDNMKDFFTIIRGGIDMTYRSSQSVNEYIESHIGNWESFMAAESSKLPHIPTENEAKLDIERTMSAWQKKGPYESTEEWASRVNAKTRESKLSALIKEWNNRAEKAIRDYNKQVPIIKEKYQNERKRLKKEFYIELAKKVAQEYRDDEYTLSADYDADNQTFLINTKRHGDMLLYVPRDEARNFRSNWHNIVKNIDFAFIPDSESSVGLSKIIFPHNGKEYCYTGETEVAYNVENADYTFTPVEVTGLKFENITLPDFEESSVSSKTLTAKKGEEKKIEKSKKSDVDTNIPIGKIKRENTFAFLIANENYSRTDPVDYALNDGEVMKQYCIKALGIPEKNVNYVTNASLNDMRYQIKRISDICNAFSGDASIVVYYAGHGVPDESSMDSYLLPVDGFAENAKTGISLKEIIDTLSNLPAANITLLLDACFSGTDRGGKSLYASRGVALRPKPIAPKGNLVVFSASQGVESAQPFKEQGHGLFTYYLLKKLKETEGHVTLGELADYLIENVKKTSVVEGKVQTPAVKASPDLSDWRATHF